MTEAMKVVIIDDEWDMRQSVKQWLALSGFEVQAFTGPEEALGVLDAGFPGAVISDIKMPGMNGMQFLKHLLGVDGTIPVIMMTGHGDIAMAVEAIQLGAYDFLEKPFDPERMTRLVEKAANYRRLTLENRALRSELSNNGTALRRLAGTSPEMERLRDEIVDLGQVEAHILIEGETGVGKTLVAHALHAAGPNVGKKLVLVSCATHDERTLGEHLFGSAQGGNRLSALEEARGGTLVLEYVEVLTPALQVRLLTWMNDQGSPPETRIIAISNLREMDRTCKDLLRPDLYFRLAAVSITPPPLRFRGDDILSLFRVFRERFAEEYGCESFELSEEDEALLLRAPWPGNVRQLRNVAERAVLRSRYGSGSLASLLDAENDGVQPMSTYQGKPLRYCIEEFERALIDGTLRRHKGSVIETMEELCLPRRTLNEKMTKHGLRRSDYL